jgi:hypothetical protein
LNFQEPYPSLSFKDKKDAYHIDVFVLLFLLLPLIVT